MPQKDMKEENKEMMEESWQKKRVLVAEDDPDIMKVFIKILEKYKEFVDIDKAQDAEVTFNKLFERRPDALILDNMMEYFGLKKLLDPKNTDPQAIESGLRIIEKLREDEKSKGYAPLWVSVVTARSAAGFIRKTEKALEGYGKVYSKPFDDLIFEADLMAILEIECLVHKVLLPNDYEKPIPGRGGI